jgi:hypothetical protein
MPGSQELGLFQGFKLEIVFQRLTLKLHSRVMMKNTSKRSRPAAGIQLP